MRTRYPGKGLNMRAKAEAGAVAVALLLAGAGCGSAHPTRVESAGGTADTLIKSCAAGRTQASLEVLSLPARESLVNAPSARTGCLRLLGLPPGTALGGARVVSVRANDLSATAELRAQDGASARLELEKSRGVWAVVYPR
jgi:hypothetical protein